MAMSLNLLKSRAWNRTIGYEARVDRRSVTTVSGSASLVYETVALGYTSTMIRASCTASLTTTAT
jgi:hypothetical protein